MHITVSVLFHTDLTQERIAGRYLVTRMRRAVLSISPIRNRVDELFGHNNDISDIYEQF